MIKEFHLWFKEGYPEDTLHVYGDVMFWLYDRKIDNYPDDIIVHTTQVCTCRTNLLTRGFRIFIHPAEGNTFEIKLGENDNIERIINEGHNLMNLLIAGEWDHDGCEVW